MEKTLKVMFAGGGTGGHVYPALAVAEALSGRHAGFEALFIGTRAGLEAKVVPESGNRIIFISSRGVRGRGVTGKIRTMFSIAAGIVKSSVIIMRFKPDLVFGSGGYASVAAVFAALLLGRRVVIQEQNSVPGLANRFLARRAERIYLGFRDAAAYFGKRKGIVFTGNPLRRDIAEMIGPQMPPAGKRGKARESFGLSQDKPVLLVFGGSQGARTLNRAAAGYLMASENVQGIVQTGRRDYAEMKASLSAAGSRVFVTEYISNINSAYMAADAALARSGALSVSELAAVGLPCVLVPYPFSADDHQTGNALVLARAGGAVIISDGDLDATTLEGALSGMIHDPGVLSKMRESLRTVYVADSAVKIASDIEGLLEMVPCSDRGGARPGRAERAGGEERGRNGQCSVK